MKRIVFKVVNVMKFWNKTNILEELNTSVFRAVESAKQET
jgi:hypothetical protein